MKPVSSRAVRSSWSVRLVWTPELLGESRPTTDGAERLAGRGRPQAATGHAAEVRGVEAVIELVGGVAQRVGDRQVRVEIVLEARAVPMSTVEMAWSEVSP